MKRCAYLATAVIVLGSGLSALGQQQRLEITLVFDTPTSQWRPVCVPLSLPPALDKETFATVTLHFDAKRTLALPGQLTAPGLMTEDLKPSAAGLVRRDLHVVLPADVGKNVNLTVAPGLPKDAKPDEENLFVWIPKGKSYAELQYGTIPVLRYMHQAYDPSTTENRDKTYKVFHHLYDPSGKRLVTNGGNTNDLLPKNPKDLLYPHHRGLMYAFNKITFDGKKTCDTWHAKPGDTHQSHEGFLASEAGWLLGRHRVAVDWHGPNKEVFAREEREITVYKTGKATLVEFASRLKTTGGKVKLDGDPQHAGFQFRAHNDLHEQKNDKQTYYVRPDGKGKPGDTRNWDPKTGKGPVDLGWDAMSFVLDGKRYTVAYMDHPKNPHPSRWSERDYGRFGCYFEYELTEQHPLVVNYRFWLQDGEMTGDQVEALSRAFVQPPKVTVK
jgi:hypothetical protein